MGGGDFRREAGVVVAKRDFGGAVSAALVTGTGMGLPQPGQTINVSASPLSPAT